jgi:tungstate transport system permease protein
MQFILDGFLSALRMIFSLDSEVYFVVWTSLQVSIIAVFFSTLVGVPLGLIAATRTFPGKQALILALNTSMALPTVVVGLLLYAFISRRGPLGELGLLFTPAGVSLGLFMLSLPLVTNLTLSGIQSSDPRLFVTCKLLGATPVQQGIMILKEARFAVMAGIVVAFGRVISEVGIAMMLGGNIKGYTRTMTTAIALETSKGEFELGMALGIFLLAVAFFINGILFALQRRKA